jgi:hypothetical protein
VSKTSFVGCIDLPSDNLLNSFEDEELVDTSDFPIDKPLKDADNDAFTRNRVVIEQTGDFPALEIVDMPGLQAANENVAVQNKIRTLTEEEISKPHTFTLLVLRATSEPTHHSILNYVRKNDKAYQRTIGTLQSNLLSVLHLKGLQDSLVFTAVALSRTDEMSGTTSPWFDEIKKYPETHCFVASAIPAGLIESPADREQNELKAFDNWMKPTSRHCLLNNATKDQLGVTNLVRMFGLKIVREEVQM